MRGSVADKIFASLAGTPALAFSLRAFEAAGIFARAVFVFRDEAQRGAIGALAEKFSPALAESALFCRGGNERKDSVLNGLACAREAGVPADAPAFIHDCARPLVSAETLRELAALAAREGSAVLAHRCRNTVKRVPADAAPGTACAAEDLDRSRLWETETPQVFPLGKILGAYRKIRDEGLFVTDDAAAAQAAGMPVALAENFSPNPKITVRLLRGAFARRRGNAQRPIPASRLTRPEQNFSAAARTSVTASPVAWELTTSRIASMRAKLM